MLAKNYRQDIRNKYFGGNLFPRRDEIADALYEEEDPVYRLFLHQMFIDLEES